MSTNTVERQRTHPAPGARTGHPRWSGVAAIALGIGAAIVAILGPLATGVIRYHASDGAINQIAGGDAAGLLLAAPTGVIAGFLILRGHRAGPVLALAPAVYVLYTYTQLAIGGDMVRYDGNSERFFPLFVGLFVLAGAITARAWSSLEHRDLPATSRGTDRALGILLLVVAAFLLVGLHLPGLVDAWSANPTGPEYLADPNVFWLVKFMDLAIVVPALITIGIGVLRGSAWAHKAKYPAVGWFALLGSSVAGMAIVMQATGDPAGTTANTIAFVSFALFALALATVIYRPLFHTPTEG